MHRSSRLPFCLIVPFLALVTGCSASVPAGQWRTDPAVAAWFEAGRVLPGYTYYYLGSSTAPDSIIAIDHRFTLRSRVWAQVELDQRMLNGWLQWYRSVQPPAGCEFRGGIIETSTGEPAGYWYSRNPINIVHLPEPGVLEVFQPHTLGGATCGQPSAGPFGDDP